jgi:hypothetical protein
LTRLASPGLALLLLLACSPADLPSPGEPAGTAGLGGLGGSAGPGGVSGTSGHGGAAGISGTSGQGGASGQGGLSGASGQAGEGGAGGLSGTSGQGGAAGGGAGEGGAAGGGGCAQDGDCKAEGPCLVCSPVSHACPRARCVAGACEEEPAACAGQSCAPMAVQGVGGCEFVLGWGWDGVSCELLLGCGCEGPDCAQLTATQESCLQGRERCTDPALPCIGRPCGAPCSPCPPGVTCPEVPYRCDAAGACSAEAPVCPVCQADGECISPPPLFCPNNATITPKARCDAGTCVVPPYECPPYNVCDDTFYAFSALPGCGNISWGFTWEKGACIELFGCSLLIEPSLLYPDWASCYEPRKGCVGAPCQEASDCPAVTKCPLCPGGESACPAATCEAGSCRYQEGVCP